MIITRNITFYNALQILSNKILKRRLKNVVILIRSFNNTTFSVMKIPNNSAYYPDEIRIYVRKPKQSAAVISAYFFYVLSLLAWALRCKLGISYKSPFIYYVHPTRVVTPFLLPDPATAFFSRRRYKAEVIEACGWKPANAPNPISKHDFLNQSLGIIDHKVKSKKNSYKSHSFDKNTGRHINRPQSPLIKIYIFILLTNSLTETSLHLSFITTIIKTINTWFLTHPNTFYDKYSFSIHVRLIFDPKKTSRKVYPSSPFVHTSHKFYTQNKINNKLVFNLKVFQGVLDEYYKYLQKIQENKKISVSDMHISNLQELYKRDITPYLDEQPNLISLLPLPNERSLPFYNALFSQSLHEVLCRVRKHSSVSLSTIDIIPIGPFNPLLIPIRFPQGSHSAQYNINSFLFLNPEDLKHFNP